MDRSSILRASTRINKRRSFERRFLWMSVRVGRLEGLAKEASDVRFRAFNEACAPFNRRFAAHFGFRYSRACQCVLRFVR